MINNNRNLLLHHAAALAQEDHKAKMVIAERANNINVLVLKPYLSVMDVTSLLHSTSYVPVLKGP